MSTRPASEATSTSVSVAVPWPQAAAGASTAPLVLDMEVDLDNRVMQLDQSVNQAISTEGGPGGGNVGQVFGQNATVSFGDGSNAAGRDVNIDNSELDLEVGDINIGNTDISTRINDSFNDYSTEMDMEWDLEIEDSFNDQSTNTEVEVEVDDSFTSEVDAAFDNSLEWENSGNIFSPGAATSPAECRGRDGSSTSDHHALISGARSPSRRSGTRCLTRRGRRPGWGST